MRGCASEARWRCRSFEGGPPEENCCFRGEAAKANQEPIRRAEHAADSRHSVFLKVPVGEQSSDTSAEKVQLASEL